MSDTIASAVLEYTADSSGVSAAMASATQSVQKFEQAATGAGKKAGETLQKTTKDAAAGTSTLTREQERVINAIERYGSTVGKTRAEVLEFKASQAGISDQVQAQIAALKAQEAALRSTGTQLNKYGISAAQNAAALRNVPAQVTDIIVGLQGGQAPLTVLLQQGGQLKDMFGGVVPAARALGGALLALINPYTLVAAAAAALVVAYYQGSKEAQAYSTALILSGNAAGTTASQMQDMAAAIAKANSSITQSAASQALAALAQTGDVGAESLQKYATAAADFERVTGQAVTKTAEVFKDLERAPLEASVKLNAEIHHLTMTTYEHIKALTDQGRMTDAARAAQDAYAEALASRATQITQNLGFIETAWKGVIRFASWGWDAMLGVGRSQTGSEQLESLRKQLEERQARGPLNSVPGMAASWEKGNEAIRAQIAYIERLNAQMKTTAAEQGKAAKQVEARARWDKEGEQFLSNREKREQAIARVRQEGLAAGRSEAEIQQRIADITEKLKDPKTAAFRDDAGVKMLETLRQQEAAFKDQLTSVGKMTDAEKEQAKFVQLIADLKGKDQLTADQKSLLASQDKIKAQLAINVGLEREIGFQKILTDDTKRRADALKATENAADGVRRSLEDMRRQQGEQYDDRLGVIGLGSEAAEQQRSREQVERQYARVLRSFTEEAAKNKTLESDAYKKTTADIQTALQAALAANDEYYAAIRKKQGDWSLGASEALNNYANDSANVFKQTEQLVGRAFGGMEDALVSLVTTGKADFKSLINSIIADLARLTIRQGVTGPLSRALAGMLAGGAGAVSGDADYLSQIGLSGSSGLSVTGGSGGFNWGSLFSSIAGGLFRADGGPVTPGVPYTVGERGREVFVPNAAGTIIPNDQLGGGPITIVNQTTGRIDSVQERRMPDGERQLIISEAVNRTVAQLNDPNSKMSKTLGRNYTTQRAR